MVTRKTEQSREKTDKPCPKAILNYTRSKTDQKREYYGAGQIFKN
jgi:hypothetical protein